VVSSDRDVETGREASEEAPPHDGPSADDVGQAAARPGAVRGPSASPGDGLRLAELLAARLCHEVSGPAGTLAGAVEIARTEPDSAAEALDIAAQAATGLATRLRLLRAAWAGGEGELDVQTLRSLSAGLPGRSRLELDFSGLAPGIAFAPDAGRVVLNMLMLAAESLPAGGAISLAGDPRHAVSVSISGPRAAWTPGLAICLSDPDALDRQFGAPRLLQGPLTALIAHTAGLRLSLLLGAADLAPPLLLTIA